MVEQSEHYAKERNHYLEKAKMAKSIYDSAFYIHYYNSNRRYWQGGDKTTTITPTEVFCPFNQSTYQQALAKAEALLSAAPYIGAAYFQYDNSPTYEQALKQVQETHPEFCSEIYGMVAQVGMISMR